MGGQFYQERQTFARKQTVQVWGAAVGAHLVRVDERVALNKRLAVPRAYLRQLSMHLAANLRTKLWHSPV